MTAQSPVKQQDQPGATPVTPVTDPAGDDIVVGVDGSQSAKHALRWALEEALRRQVRCQVIQVCNPSVMDMVDPRPEHCNIDDREHQLSALTALSAMVDDMLADLQPSFSPEVEVRRGDPVEVLAESAQHADLLVVGSQGHGLISRVLGSVSSALLYRGICPTIVVSPDADTYGRHGRVVVGVDGSDGAARALDWAADEARRRHAQLVVLHAWHLQDIMGSPYAPTVAVPVADYESAGREILAQALRQLEPGADFFVVPSLVEDVAHSALVKAATEADLMVVGSRGHSGLAAAILGSTSRSCVHHSTCAVAVIP